MKTTEAGLLKWWIDLVARRPRIAIIGGCGIIILFLTTVLAINYREKNELYRLLADSREKCYNEKIDIINFSIKRQEEANEKYSKKVEDLYEKLNQIKIEIKKK